MYRDNGVVRGYEDAIPIKRSKKSERTRSEIRSTAAKNRGSVEFAVSRVEPQAKAAPIKGPQTLVVTRQIPKKTEGEVQTPQRKQIGPPEKKAASPVKQNSVQSQQAKPEAVSAPAVKTAKTADAEQSAPATKPVSAKTAPSSVKDRTLSAVFGAEAADTETAAEHEKNAKTEKNGAVAGLSTVVRAERTEAVQAKENSAVPRLTAGKVIRRSLLSVFTALLLVVAAVFGACYTVAVGPSESVRNILVLSALQASATKWVPGLFLDDAVVQGILEDSKKVNKDVISVEDYQNQKNESDSGDKWANAIDGMVYESVSGPTFKGYVLLVKDPSRVSVGVATTEFTNDTPGLRIFDMAEKYGAVAAINGGEYPDAGGMGIGGRPIGLTYSDGNCVWNDGLRRSFMGFDENDRLIVREGLTYAEAEELGIRDGVCFQTGKTLITNEDGNVTLYYADNDTGTAQRTAIGQTADGTVILLVTDGRTASSLGATHNDVIDVMVSYGAVSAGMLDGGSSSLMYYRDFYDKYGLDKSGLDEYQRMGLINKYKAFTTPRRLPTCFIVAPE